MACTGGIYAAADGNECFEQPQRVNDFAAEWPLVEDIFTSPAAHEVRTHLLAQAVQSGECRYLSVDGTFRVCLPLLGQAKFNDPASVRACAPFQDITRSIRICVSMPMDFGTLELQWNSKTQDFSISFSNLEEKKKWETIWKSEMVQIKLNSLSKKFGKNQRRSG